MSKHYKTYSRSEFLLNHCTPNTECRVVTAAETPYDETTFRPLTGSVVVDAGSSSDSKATQYNYENLTNGWPTAWLAEAIKDYYGGERVVNGKIDIGCGEMQPVEGAVLAISDSLNDLVIAGDMTEKGEFQLEIGKDYTITVSRSLTSELLCKGVIVNGVFHSFPTTGNEQPYEISLKGEDGRYSYITAVYETNPKDWYVNSDIGKNSNRGYHKNCPLKTLDKVMELADSGDIVHAAAGIYKSFADGEEYASANSRVTVKAGVGLVADDWPLKETVIEGEPDTTESADKYGNGPNAVRCVTVMENGYVRGFKLTKGHTLLKATAGDTTKGGACGGGALLTTSAALIDCELTGNICDYRGRAVAGDSSCWLIRCYVHDNEDTDEKGYTDVYDRMSLVDTCIITDDVRAYYGRGNIVNSTIMGRARLSGGSTYIYNSYIDTMEHNNKNFECRNCAFGNESSDVNADNTTLDACIFSVKVADTSDENYCPPMEITALVDAGNKKYYNDIFQHENFPAQAVQFRNDRDLANGQRVYNGKIDIGCGEYDFRSDFARILGARAVISEMGPNVTTNAVPDIVVPEGESIAMSVAPLASDRNTQYKFVYTPDGGSQTVVSEKSTDAFTRTLDGPCTVQTLTGYLGFVFQVR